MATKKTKSAPAEHVGADNGKFQERADAIFESYPNAEELHFTSDGLSFLLECDAKNHAASLKENQIETIKRK